jgi:hypothetical protein
MTLTAFPNGISSFGVPLLGGGGLLRQGKAYFVDAANGSDGNSGLDISQPVKLPATALDKTVSEAGDVVYVLGSSSTANFATSYTLSKNSVSLVGVSTPSVHWQRSRMGASADMSPLITISGSYNYFQNIRFGYGRGTGTNLNMIYITGSYNTFENCHFAGPFNDTEAAAAGYRNISLASGCQGNFFKNCTIGIDTIKITSTDFAHVSTTGGVSELIFEDCRFVKWIPDTGCLGGVNDFLLTDNSAISRFAEFKRCRFISFVSNWGAAATGAIYASNTASGIILVDNCTFLNYTDIFSYQQGRIYVNGASPTGNTNGLAVVVA